MKEKTPEQLRDMLRRAAPGAFTEEELANMSPEALRKELIRRSKAGSTPAGGYTDDEINKMTADQMRDAIRRAAPGQFTDAQLASMTR